MYAAAWLHLYSRRITRVVKSISKCVSAQLLSLKNLEIANAVHSCRQYKNLGFQDTNLFLLVVFRLDFYVVRSVNMPIALADRKIIT